MGKVIMSGIVPQLEMPVAGILASELAVGSSVYLMENVTPVEYLVVNQGKPADSSSYDDSCDGTWLLRKDIYSKRVWETDNSNNYGVSDINAWLNGTFLNLFDDIAQNVIKQIKIPYWKGMGSSGSIANGSDGLVTKVFLTSFHEAGFSGTYSAARDGECLDYFNDGDTSKRVAYMNGATTPWWHRTPYTKDAKSAYYWDAKGSCGSAGSYVSNSYGIRPVLILPNIALFDKETLVLTGVAGKLVSVSVTDVYGGESALLNTKGLLIVGGTPVWTATANVATNTSEVTVEFKLTGDIGSARNVVVNGKTVGTVNYAGDSIYTRVRVSNGNTIAITFTA